jgi:tRNA threonylcarbamoyladenosine modification (KEOPS) complex Cgi121 subunit
MVDEEMLKSVRCYKFGEGEQAQRLKKSIGSSFPDLIVQAIDSAAASNERLLEMLGEQTLQAAAGGNPLAKKAEVDLLLRVAGTTQISEAIQKVGVKDGRASLLFVAGEQSDLERLDSTRAAEWERMQSGPLTKEDLERIERAALLDAQRA